MNAEEIDLNRGLTEAVIDRLIGARNHLDFLNARNEVYRQNGMRDNPPTRAEAIRLMALHPNLIRRPLLVDGETVLFGFQADEWNKHLK